MTAHTPGPWTLDECADANEFTTVRHNDDISLEPIATVYTVDDAAIIAAAPDLLAALKFLLKFAAVELEDDGPHDACVQAEAAIAKAEGKS